MNETCLKLEDRVLNAEYETKKYQQMHKEKEYARQRMEKEMRVSKRR